MSAHEIVAQIRELRNHLSEDELTEALTAVLFELVAGLDSDEAQKRAEKALADLDSHQ
ncbi:MAG: hypothetical protein ACTHXA_08580 [Gulosibacter sp.]|uniref:hypothetical protein n=1 Tax=Gulosibacter sp. TaxID=2817531 RepID=UPI003F931CD2